MGLAVIGSVAWTAVSHIVRDSLRHLAAGHAIGGHAVGGHAVGGHGPAGPAVARPGSPIYDHALSSGVTTALTMGAGATVLALIVTLIAIRVRREDLPDGPLVM